MFWPAVAFLVLSMVLYFLARQAEASGRSEDEKAGSAFLYLAALVALILAAITWALAVTIAALL